MQFPWNPNIIVSHINSISLEDASLIENLIKEENKKKPHMLEKTAEQIIFNVKHYSWIIAQVLSEKNIIWYMWLDKTQEKFKDHDIFERWSLIVTPEYRWNMLGSFLRKYLLDMNKEKCIYSVSCIPKVIEENKKIGEISLTQEYVYKVSKDLYDLIENEGKFYEDDVIFVNKTLYNIMHK